MLTERTRYWPLEGKMADVLAIRREASQIRLRLGLPAGRVAVGQEGGETTVEWECGFPDGAAQEADLAARGKSRDFLAVRARMGHVIREFRRSLLEHDTARIGGVMPHWDGDLPTAPRDVQFISGNLTLAGYLYLPAGAGPFPAMVVNHGSGVMQGSAEVSRPGIAALLLSWGIACLMPNRRGYGSSPGTPWREEVSAPFGTDAYDAALAKRLDGESDDVVAAHGYLAGLAEIDAERIGVIGSSFGGTVTLLAASKCPNFRCAVDFAGAAMNWDRTPGLRALMISAAHRLTRPACFFQAANDFSIRPTLELSAALAGSGKMIESHVFPAFGVTPDEGHALFRDGIVVWAPRVRQFLQRWL